MDIKSHLHSSAASSSTGEARLTSKSFTDVISHGVITAPTGCDVTVSRHYEVWNAGEVSDTSRGMMYNITPLDSSGSTFDVTSPAQDAPDTDTPAFCDVITTFAAEPPRCLDNGSDVTSSAAVTQELTQLSPVCAKRESVVYNVRNDHHFADDDVTRQQFPVVAYNDVIVKLDDERRRDDMTSSATTTAVPNTQYLASSEDIETYFSTVDRLRSIDATKQHHLHRLPAPSHYPHHHVYYQHHPARQSQQHVYAERLSSPQVSFSSSSSTSDVEQQFYASLYNYSAELGGQRVTATSLPLHQSLATAANYQESTAGRMSNSSTSLTGLVPVHITTSETTDASRSTLMPMLCYSPSTTSSSHHKGGSDGDVSGSFSALLHSSPVTHHVDVGLSSTSAGYAGDHGSAADYSVESGARRQLTDPTHAADVMDSASLSFYNLMQPSSCYGDDQMTDWSSSGIVTLINSFAGSVTEYPSRFVTFILRAHALFFCFVRWLLFC